MEKINNAIYPITDEKIFRFFDKQVADEISTNGKIAIRKLMGEIKIKFDESNIC